MNRMQNKFLKLFKIINKEEIKILPGHLAYFFMLSLIPAITIFGIVCNIFGLSINNITDSISNILPNGVTAIIDPFIKDSLDGLTIFYFVIGFILVSNGAYALIRTANALYKVKHNNYLEGRLKSLFLTILLMFIFIFILLVLAFGNMIITNLFSLKLFSNYQLWLYNLFVYVKWPISFFIIFIILKLIYTIAPAKRIKSSTVTNGVIFTTCGWIIITALYAFYANNIARYDMFYGNLSNIIVLMMWIYFIAYIFVIGLAINARVYDEVEVISNNNSN